MVASSPVEAALGRVTAGLPGNESRPSQLSMAEAVSAAIDRRRNLVVQAGTGTGKSLGYLVPTILAGTRVVVATATKALQDQLASRDLPLLAAELGVPVVFAVLKGRSNYLCVQRIKEIDRAGEQAPLPGAGIPDAEPGPLGRELRRLVAWAPETASGDRAELAWEPSEQAWSQVSVGSRDCPGAGRCPSGGDCFAEAARRRAAGADVVVVNTHLYAAHLASRGELLPPHDVVVFDEAHELEDIASASFGAEVSPGRFAALARSARPLVADPAVLDALAEAGSLLAGALGPFLGRRLPRPHGDQLATALATARGRVAALDAALRHKPDGPPGAAADDDGQRRLRAQRSALHLAGDLDSLIEPDDSMVAWVEGQAHSPSARLAPLDVAEVLSRTLWSGEAAPIGVLTSATIPPRLVERVGLPAERTDQLDVGSPFDYPSQALLYCAAHLPSPKDPGFEAAALEELVALVTAAGGRTMALFTSQRAMLATSAAVARRIPWPVLTQGELPKAALVARFSADERSCLFATMGFWQGVDVPGPSLSLVVIDRLPFPRPDDPLLEARRERLGRAAFGAIDLPRAATLLAQGAGRLVRSSTDRGAVAVLDPRLATARYRWDLVRALPPMRRTRHRSEVEAWLAPLRAGGSPLRSPPAPSPAAASRCAAGDRSTISPRVVVRVAGGLPPPER